MNEEKIIVIRTTECDICSRFDSVLLSKEEIRKRTYNDMEIGSHDFIHKDHTRIVYFDEDGEYLGDTISMSLS